MRTRNSRQRSCAQCILALMTGHFAEPAGANQRPRGVLRCIKICRAPTFTTIARALGQRLDRHRTSPEAPGCCEPAHWRRRSACCRATVTASVGSERPCAAASANDFKAAAASRTASSAQPRVPLSRAKSPRQKRSSSSDRPGGRWRVRRAALTTSSQSAPCWAVRRARSSGAKAVAAECAACVTRVCGSRANWLVLEPAIAAGDGLWWP